MDNLALEVKHLRKVYQLYNKPIDRLKESLGWKKTYHKEFYALNDLSFSVNKGETIGIIGTNGSGKSTLLKIITGVLTPTAGEINVNGKISALLELGAGFNPEYSGLDNIYLNGSMMGFTREEIDKKIDAVLEFASIGEFINQPVKNYSSGMFARLAFAIAINVDPDILIVDEALSVGDVYFQSKCFKKINQIKENGTTILLVSHDMGSVIKYCDRVVLLNNGQFIAQGNPKEMVDIYKQILVNQFNDQKDAENSELNLNETSNDAMFEAENFNDANALWKEKLLLSNYKLEYGNKEAEIFDFAIIDENNNITSQIFKDKNFKIIMKVKFNQEIENPIFAFTIKDLKGTELTGTNTQIEKHEIEDAETGATYTICFEQKMSLQGGEYLLSLGCTGFNQDEFVVYHRLYDVLNISVISDKNTVGVFDMGSDVFIQKD
jgi:ABC-type polysaccharide/polyol phosphate transport system, ATPase component